MNNPDYINTYADFTSTLSIRNKARKQFRKAAIVSGSLRRKISGKDNWIRMIYYHHVFDDERKDFERQMKYLNNFGDFISIDQVCDMVNGTQAMDGKYFCITFDDGFRNTYTNMMAITANLDIPVIVYVPTAYIEGDTENPEVVAYMRGFAPKNSRLIQFLNWDECREMQKHNITIGSHTVTHPILSQLSYSEVEYQLSHSKKVIEEKLGTPCLHFASPKGVAGKHFDPEITGEIARKCGYKTLVSVKRGKIKEGHNVYLLNREHLIARWENYQIKYFFGKES